MVGEPSHVKQLSLIHVCKIGLTSSVQIEVAFQDKQKKQFLHLCSVCVTSNNEHIIIRQARDQGCPAEF
jgi:hypothetical protein